MGLSNQANQQTLITSSPKISQEQEFLRLKNTASEILNKSKE